MFVFVFTSIVNISSASVSAASRYVRLSSVAAAMTENRLCPVVIQAKGDRVKKSQKKELTSFKFKNKFFFGKNPNNNQSLLPVRFIVYVRYQTGWMNVQVHVHMKSSYKMRTESLSTKGHIFLVLTLQP